MKNKLILLLMLVTGSAMQAFAAECTGKAFTKSIKLADIPAKGWEITPDCKHDKVTLKVTAVNEKDAPNYVLKFKDAASAAVEIKAKANKAEITFELFKDKTNYLEKVKYPVTIEMWNGAKKEHTITLKEKAAPPAPAKYEPKPGLDNKTCTGSEIVLKNDLAKLGKEWKEKVKCNQDKVTIVIGGVENATEGAKYLLKGKIKDKAVEPKTEAKDNTITFKLFEGEESFLNEMGTVLTLTLFKGTEKVSLISLEYGEAAAKPEEETDEPTLKPYTGNLPDFMEKGRESGVCAGCTNETCVPAFDASAGFHIVYNPCCTKQTADGQQLGFTNQLSMLRPKPKALSYSRRFTPIQAGSYRTIYNSRFFNARYGSPLAFDIININPFKYNVAIVKSDTNYNESDAKRVTDVIEGILNAGLGKASGTDEEKEKAEKVVGYVLEVGRQLAGYMEEMKSKECVDLNLLSATRQKVLSDIDSKFQHDLKFSFNETDIRNAVINYLHRDKPADTMIIYRLNKALAVYREYKNFTFQHTYLVPQVQNKDEVVYQITILPKDTNASGIRVNKEEIRVPVLGGFKIDGSIGVFYSGLTSHRYYAQPDSFYTYSNNGQDSTLNRGYRVRNSKTNFAGEFGAMALIHFYPRISRVVNVAFVGGVGVTIEKIPQPRGMAGASIMFGKANRLAISGGLVFGEVDRLRPEFTKAGLYSEGSNYTKKQMKAGGFISLSYNFNFTTPKGAVQQAGGEPAPKKEGDGKDTEKPKDDNEPKVEEKKDEAQEEEPKGNGKKEDEANDDNAAGNGGEEEK